MERRRRCRCRCRWRWRGVKRRIGRGRADDASHNASRMASRPSNFPTCPPRRRSRNDDMIMLSRLRYCSRLASRLRCPRLRVTTSSTCLPYVDDEASSFVVVVARWFASPAVALSTLDVAGLIVAASSFSFVPRWCDDDGDDDVSGAALTSRDDALEAARNFPTFVAFGMVFNLSSLSILSPSSLSSCSVI